MGVLIAQHLTLDLDVSTTLPKPPTPARRFQKQPEDKKRVQEQARRRENTAEVQESGLSKQRGCDRGEPNNKLGGGGGLLLYSFEPQTD